MLFIFGDFEFHTEQLQLRRGETLVPLEPKAYQVLELLLRHRDRIVRKEELLSTVWRGASVDEAAIRRTVRILRKALGDEGAQERYIATRHGIGYRFIAEVQELSERPSSVVAPAPEPPEAPKPAAPNPAAPNPAAPNPAAPNSAESSYSFLRVASLLNLHKEGAARLQTTGGVPHPTAPVFLDVSYLLALAVRDHPRHLRALELAEWLQSDSRRIITTDSVLQRFLEACREERFGQEAGERLYKTLLNDEAVEIVPVSQDLLESMIDRYWGAGKHRFTPFDCTAFILMERHGAVEALSDREAFELAGFQALLRRSSKLYESWQIRRDRFRALFLYLLPFVSFIPFVALIAAERMGGDQSFFVRVLQIQPAATVGIPTAALIALGVTIFFQLLTHDDIRIDIFRLRLAGPAAFLIVWVICFLAIVLGIFLLWTGR